MSYLQGTLASGSVVPALSECLGCCRHLHHQTALAILDRDEVVVLVKRLCLVVYRINDDESCSADFRCGDGFPQCIQK